MHANPQTYQISALVALAEINLVIQNRPWISSSLAASTLAAYCLSHLFFGLVHWLAFAAIVGVTAERNPYGLGLRTASAPVRQGSSTRRSGSRKQGGLWRERVANVQVQQEALYEEPENLEGDGNNSSGWDARIGERQRLNERSFRSDGEDGLENSSDEDRYLDDDDIHSENDYPIDALRRYSHGDDSEESHPEETDEDGLAEAESSDDDPNDIIDIIPSPSGAPRRRAISQSKSLRSRKSFFRSDSGSPEELTSRVDGSATAREGHGKMHGYGTFRSLAGI